MSTKTNIMKVRFVYVDNSERLYSMNIGDIPDATTANAIVSNAKTRIQAFNTDAANASSDVAQTFISNNGARVEAISEAELVVTEEEVLYSG